uniref:Late embryogenesis abundant protein LEA-2 subgroup domain-containing protein n=1 Tax=Oryza glumipatula TaxID=40148 RepID=A0A0E0A494_9ORYZ
MDDDEKGRKEEDKLSASSWQARRHLMVLAALGATVAATAVVITVFVILRPAHLEFAVTRATQHNTTKAHDGMDGMYLNLTVAAKTTGGRRRATVEYRSLSVYLVVRTRLTQVVGGSEMNTSTFIQNFFIATLQPPLPVSGTGRNLGLGTPASTTRSTVNASLQVLLGDSQELSSSNILATQLSRNGSVTVVIAAQVVFNIGFVTTRVYVVRARCPHVFFNQQLKAPPYAVTGRETLCS